MSSNVNLPNDFLAESLNQNIFEYVVAIGGLMLLISAAYLYYRSRQQQRRIEFAVFSSQIINKDSSRSTSQNDFPTFEVEPKQDNDEQRSSQRRRRKRKANRLVKPEEKDNSLQRKGQHMYSETNE